MCSRELIGSEDRMMHIGRQRRKASRRRAGGRRAFTLAELLAVIAIMAIMIAVSVPALSGLARGASLRSATVQLRSALSLARQYAITHHQTVYVLFPTQNNDPIVGGDATRTRGYRAYAICTVSNNIPTYLSEWQFLPTGVIIMTNSDVYGGTSLYTNSASGLGLPSAANLNALRFKMDGSVNDFYTHIILGEGFIGPGGSPIMKGNSGTNVVTVYGLTGTAKVE